jgi:hypothetical protein
MEFTSLPQKKRGDFYEKEQKTALLFFSTIARKTQIRESFTYFYYLGKNPEFSD